MSENDRPNLDDVLPATEHAPRDRQEHGKAPDRVNDDELQHRTEQERVAVGIDDYDPDDIPPATS